VVFIEERTEKKYKSRSRERGKRNLGDGRGEEKKGAKDIKFSESARGS